MRNLTFGSEVRKASDKPSDNGPVYTGPRQHQPDSVTALNCTDATQRDPSRRNERPW